MKACVIAQFGGNEVIEYREHTSIPEIAPDQILVKNRYASINPVDWKIREGYFASFLNSHLPLVLGRDFCGEVMKVGGDVTDYTVGDIVCGYIPFNDGYAGTFAEYLCISQPLACKVPLTVSEISAASLPLVGLTAWQGIFEQIQIKAKDRLLVLGGATSVGNIAIQLAHLQGAHIFATAKNDCFPALHSIGVAQCIDYQNKNFSAIVFDSLDAVYDCVGSEEEIERAIDLVKKGGKIVSISIFSFSERLVELAAKKNIALTSYILRPNKAYLEAMLNFMSQGKLILRPVELLEFSEIPRALAASQNQQARRKMVIKIS